MLLNFLIVFFGLEDKMLFNMIIQLLQSQLDVFIVFGNIFVNGEFLFVGIDMVNQLFKFYDINVVVKVMFNIVLMNYMVVNGIGFMLNFIVVQMQDFVENILILMYIVGNLVDVWKIDWFFVFDMNMILWVNMVEIVQSLINVNNDGFCKFVLVFVMGIELFGMDINLDVC